MLDAFAHQVRLRSVDPLQQLAEDLVAVVHVVVAGCLAQPEQVVGFGELPGFLFGHLSLNFDGDGGGAGVVGSTRVGVRHHAAALLLQAADVHGHQIGVVLFLEVLVGQTRWTGEHLSVALAMLVDHAVVREGLLVLCDAGFQTGSLDLWLATVYVGLITDVLPAIWLLLLMYDWHRLTVHVMRLYWLLLVVGLYRLSSTPKGRIRTAGAFGTLLPVGARRRAFRRLLREHLLVLSQHVALLGEGRLLILR